MKERDGLLTEVLLLRGGEMPSVVDEYNEVDGRPPGKGVCETICRESRDRSVM
jgi:hypothetical protein